MTGVAWLQAGAIGALGFLLAVMVYGIVRWIRRADVVAPERRKWSQTARARKPRGSSGPPSIPHSPVPAVTRSSVDDPHERAEYEREMEHLARTRSIPPSRSVEPEARGRKGESREE